MTRTPIPVDPRRAAALRADLLRLAAVLTPGWEPTGAPDDVGSALVAIAARLAEETTSRLDRTPERDALAFLDHLGLRPAPPRAATGTLVLALADGTTRRVFAPARTQVSVAGDHDDVTFETRHGVSVVPGRIADVVAVDPSTDRIETAPAPVTALERGTAFAGVARAPAGAGSRSLQVTPAVGLAAGDVLRVGTAAYPIAAVDTGTGIVTLDDPLDTPVAVGAAVTRIAELETLTLRDRQRHVLYIGHSELLDLEQPAEISLTPTPPRLARELARLDVAWELWGTPDGGADPVWCPLVLRGTGGGRIDLVKPEVGTVEETEVDGRRNRWLRARLREPVTGARAPGAPVARLLVRVASPAAGPAADEGSRTVTRAVHNGTPLSTARRFHPFGTEPLRFDVFAFAAPEALSKKGAQVTVDVRPVDSSPVRLEIAALAGAGTGHRGYGVGLNGDLQVLRLAVDGGLRWHSLRALGEDGRLLLDGAAAVETGTAGVDLVVVRDRDGATRAARVRRPDPLAAPEADGLWQVVPDTPPDPGPARGGRLPGPVLAPAPTGTDTTALAVAVAGRTLQTLRFDGAGVAADTWRPVVDSTPAPSGSWQLTAVQGPDWPTRPTQTELLAVDDDGVLWLGTLTPAGAADGSYDAAWRRLAAAGAPPAALDVAPVATRFRDANGRPDLWVAYGAAGGRLHGLVVRGSDPPQHVSGDGFPDAVVAPGSGLHSDPAVVGSDGRPVTVGLAPDGGAVVWPGPEGTVSAPPPGDGHRRPDRVPLPRPLLLSGGADRPPEVVVGGLGERLFRAALEPAAVPYVLHGAVRVTSTRPVDWIEIGDPATLVALGRANLRIKRGDERIYQVDGVAPATGLVFLRRNRNADLTGTVDPVDRTLLRVDARHRGVRRGDRLVVEDGAYAVHAVSGRTVTLARPLPGSAATVDYVSARVRGAGTVGPGDVLALIELDTERDRVPALLVPTRDGPVRRTPSARARIGDRLWMLLDGGWTTTPAVTGAALVPGALLARPVWTESVLERGYRNPELSWEYHDGDGWRRLDAGFVDTTDNLSRAGEIRFRVPDDLAPTEIAGASDLWVRARLVGGDYGRPEYVVSSDPTTPPTATPVVQTVTVDTSGLRAPEILSIEARFDGLPDREPQVVLVENNLDVVDQTQAGAVPEARFDLFEGAAAVGGVERAVYVGLTGPVGTGTLSLLVDADDREGPEPLDVDLRTAAGWHRVPVDDRTRSLRRRGMLTVTLDVDPVPVRLFGRERVWLRLRPHQGADGWAPVVRGMYQNAVGISHARTVENELLGSGAGEPGLVVAPAQTPVLPDTLVLRVREELGDEERAALPGTADEPAVVPGTEELPGTWVLWRRVDALVGHPGDERVYELDAATGRIRFGDGCDGRVPPAGRDGIRAFRYQQGGGAAGNVPAWSTARTVSAVEGVETAVLPVATAGGSGDPTPGTASHSLLATGPDRLRHAGRALCPADVEALVGTSVADVVRARCTRPAGPGRPITVTVSVRDGSRRPVPTLAVRDAVAALVREVGWGGLGDDSVVVRGPAYVRVAVAVELAAPPAVLADVEDAARTVLLRLVHPVDGGPDGTGWPFGRTPTTGDVLRALGAVTRIGRVTSVRLSRADGLPLGELPADGQVHAEPSDVTVVVTTSEEGP